MGWVLVGTGVLSFFFGLSIYRSAVRFEAQGGLKEEPEHETKMDAYLWRTNAEGGSRRSGLLTMGLGAIAAGIGFLVVLIPQMTD